MRKIRSIPATQNESSVAVRFADESARLSPNDQATNRVHTDPVSILKRQNRKDRKVSKLNLALEQLIKDEEDSYRFFN